MDADSLENLYYGIAAVVVAILTVHGWRQGVGRQFMTLLAIAAAYAAGFFGAGVIAPWFEFLKYPEPVTRVIGGVMAGLLTLLAFTTLGKFFFKRTSDQTQGSRRRNYGALGAVLGLAFGCLVFLVTSELVRLLGALAESNIAATSQLRERPGMETTEVNPVVSGLAKLSTALNGGGSGDFFRKVDPVPTHVFTTLTKLGRMLSRPESVERFLTYPGVDELTRHPKLLALRNDPEVAQLLAGQSYFRLLRHEKVLALASDSEFAAQVKRTNFDAALDEAIKAPGRREPLRWQWNRPERP